MDEKILSSFSRSGKTGRKKRVKKPLSLCRQCGKSVKMRRNVFCSVRCMADSKKKRHQVSCIQCQKPMEVLENRFKARSYFLCSTECANDLYSKQRQAAIERDKQKRLSKQEERQRKRASLKNQWMRKAGEFASRIRSQQCSEWERKCHATHIGLKDRTAVVKFSSHPVSVEWTVHTAREMKRIAAVAKRSMKSNWELKSENISSVLRKRLRSVN